MTPATPTTKQRGDGAEEVVEPVRRRTASHEVEQALLDAAARLLETEGPEALSVRRIACEAGVAPMGVYSRFGGKSGVVEALFRAGFDQLRDRLLAVGGSDGVEALAAGCDEYRRFALERPAVYAVMFDRMIGDAPPIECKLHAADAFNVVVGAVQRGQATGRIVEGDPVELAQRVWSCCHGAVSLELRGMGFVEDRDAHYQALVATVLRGLAAG